MCGQSWPPALQDQLLGKGDRGPICTPDALPDR